MRFVTNEFRQSEWNNVVSSFEDLSLMQTWEYAEASASTGQWVVKRGVFIENDQPIGAVQALIKRVPFINKGVVWINQGPLWRQQQTPVTSLSQMLILLRQHWVTDHNMYLRIAPPVGEQIEANFFENCGFNLTEAPGWCSAKIDLAKPIEDIRADFKRKWRGDLNSAERHGVTCRIGRSDDLLESFLSYYKSFVDRKGFSTVITAPLLKRMQALFPADRKMWIFEGRLADESLGGLLVACYGNTALALAGSSPNEKGRAVHSGHMVWWQAILKMKELGYRWLDIGGTDPELTPSGILHFKAGLAAEEYRLAGEVESHKEGLFDRAVRWQIRRIRERQKRSR